MSASQTYSLTLKNIALVLHAMKMYLQHCPAHWKYWTMTPCKQQVMLWYYSNNVSKWSNMERLGRDKFDKTATALSTTSKKSSSTIELTAVRHDNTCLGGSIARDGRRQLPIGVILLWSATSIPCVPHGRTTIMAVNHHQLTGPHRTLSAAYAGYRKRPVNSWINRSICSYRALRAD
jgi:hypothetical protein